MRSSVDLPHPDGPRIVMKSLSATESVVGRRACVGGPSLTPGNVRATPSTTSLLMRIPSRKRSGARPRGGPSGSWEYLRASAPVFALGAARRAHANAHGKSFWFPHLNPKSEINPMTPITMMPKMIWPVLSRACESVIMWPMPDDAPISSATIT